MSVQVGLCRTWSEPKLLVFSGTGSTRIVRGSDFSPASELFARVRKTMAGNNPKLDLINTDAHKKIGQILSICSQGIVRKQNSESIKGHNSVKS